MKNINSDIENKTFKPVYLLYGEEDYLKKQFADRLTEAVTGGDKMNFTAFADKLDVDEAISVGSTMPFFAEKRVLYFDRLKLFKSNQDKLVEFINDIPQFLTIIIVEDTVDKRKSLYKAIAKKGYVCELDRLRERDVYRWLEDKIKSDGYDISSSDIQLIISRAGTDLNLLTSEVEKLKSYSLDDKKITRESIEELVTMQPEARVFEMVDAITSGNESKALKLYYEALQLKEAPLKLLNLMERQYLGIYKVKLYESSTSDKDMARLMGLKGVQDFVIGKYKSAARHYSLDRLKYIVRRFGETEEDIKTGRIRDITGLEIMISEALKK